MECRLEQELKVQCHNLMKKCEKDHTDPVNSLEGKQPCYFPPHHPVVKEIRSTTSNRIAFGGSAKPSNGTQQHELCVLPIDRFFHCIDKDPGSTKKLEDICRHQCSHHPRRNIFSNMDTCAISIQS